MRSIFRALCLIAVLLPCPAWAVTDNFDTGTNGDLLSTYSVNWAIAWSTEVNEARIRKPASEAGVGTDGFHDAAMYVGRTWANDQYSQVAIIDTTAFLVAACVRMDTGGSTRTGYCGGYDNEALGHNRYTIFKWVSGTLTTLATHGSTTAANSDVIKLTVTGTSLSLSVNGTPDVVTATDSDIASGNAGININGASTTLRYLDDWAGDDVSSTPTNFFQRRIQP